MIFASQDDVVAFADGAVQGMRASGYSHTQRVADEAMPVNATTTIYRIDFSRHRADGSEMERLGATYLIAAGASGPRIHAMAVHSPPPRG